MSFLTIVKTINMNPNSLLSVTSVYSRFSFYSLFLFSFPVSFLSNNYICSPTPLTYILPNIFSYQAIQHYIITLLNFYYPMYN